MPAIFKKVTGQKDDDIRDFRIQVRDGRNSKGGKLDGGNAADKTVQAGRAGLPNRNTWKVLSTAEQKAADSLESTSLRCGGAVWQKAVSPV
jgi:hypothetical protein